MRFAAIASFISILLALPLVVSAAPWVGPPCDAIPAPPPCNANAPINVGSSAQTKLGALNISNNLGAYSVWLTASGGSYISFGGVPWASGYGIRDNAGTMEYKNSAGAWAPFSSGTGPWTTSGTNIYNTNTGNVGIGTVSPAQKLHVNGSLRLSDYGGIATIDGNGRISIYSSAFTNTYLQSEAASRLTLSTSGFQFFTAPTGTAGNPVTWTERMRITPSGNVGIGTVSPQYRLHLVGAGGAWLGGADIAVSNPAAPVGNVAQFFVEGSDVGVVNYGHNGPGATYSGRLDLRVENEPRVTVLQGGNVGIGTVSPGAKLHVVQYNIEPITRSGWDVESSVEGAGLTLKSHVGAGAEGGGEPRLELLRTRGSAASPTASLNGDALGAIIFDGYVPGNLYAHTALIQSRATQDTSSTGSGGDLRFFTVPNGVNGTTGAGGPPFGTTGIDDFERMRIDQNGNVGIGTTNPVSKFTVVGSNPSIYTVGFFVGANPGGTTITFSNPGTIEPPGIGSVDDNLTLWTNRTEKVRITLAGNVGIGRTNPAYKLDVAGGVNASGGYTQVSDRRLKENIAPLENALQKVSALEGVSFSWKPGTFKAGQNDIGLIAQDVESVVPEVVVTGSDGFKSIDYSRLVPLLINAIHEQQQEIDALKEAVAGGE